MNEALIIKSIFIFITLWGLGAILLWFRPRLELFWKVIAPLIFLFYIWFFYDEIIKGYSSFVAGWYVSTMNFLKEFITLIFINLFIIWPTALIIIFYKSDEIGAERLLKFLSVLTLVLWVMFIIYFYFNAGIDDFLFDKLKKMIPDAK
jgi:hypothetical protein